MAIQFTDEMRDLINNALANKTPCMLGTASPTGEPNVGLRGSMMVFDDTRLAWWERVKRDSLRHIQVNPRVIVAFVDLTKHKAWKFYGDATVHESGPLREQVMQHVVPVELTLDPERKGLAVVVEVHRITDWRGNVLQVKEGLRRQA